MTVPAHATAHAAPRIATLPRWPLWLVGWWALGRSIVLVAATSTHAAARFAGSDGNWYRTVARSGYWALAGHSSDPAFFPLYPLLLRAVHSFGVGWGVAGPLLSNAAFLLGLGVFYLLTEELFGEGLALRAAAYLAVFPLGYVFSMTYPESVVFGLMAAAPLAALRRHWWLAALCAAAAALGRPEALFLTLPLAGLAWSRRRTFSPGELSGAVAAVLAPFAGIGSYLLYLFVALHDPFAWSRAERAWGRRFQIGGAVRAFERLPDALTSRPWLARDLACLFLYLALLYAARRIGTPKMWLAAAASVVVLPLFSGSVESIGRFGVLALPAFWGLAALGRKPRIDLAIQITSVVLLAAGTFSLAWAIP